MFQLGFASLVSRGMELLLSNIKQWLDPKSLELQNKNTDRYPSVTHPSSITTRSLSSHKSFVGLKRPPTLNSAQTSISFRLVSSHRIASPSLNQSSLHPSGGHCVLLRGICL